MTREDANVNPERSRPYLFVRSWRARCAAAPARWPCREPCAAA